MLTSFMTQTEQDRRLFLDVIQIFKVRETYRKQGAPEKHRVVMEFNPRAPLTLREYKGALAVGELRMAFLRLMSASEAEEKQGLGAPRRAGGWTRQHFSPAGRRVVADGTHRPRFVPQRLALRVAVVPRSLLESILDCK